MSQVFEGDALDLRIIDGTYWLEVYGLRGGSLYEVKTELERIALETAQLAKSLREQT